MLALRCLCRGTWISHPCSGWTLQGCSVGWKRDALHCIHASQQLLWYAIDHQGSSTVIQLWTVVGMLLHAAPFCMCRQP